MMLTIRKEQMQVFQQAAMRRFEEEMLAHCKRFSEGLCAAIGDKQVHLAVQGAIRRCDGYGFTNRGPIRLFIEMMFLFGSAFDTDPQYPWAKDILKEASDQMIRAERLHEKILDYQKNVPDLKPADIRKTLEVLITRTVELESSSITAFASDMLQAMALISPEKTAYVGEEGLTDLVLEGCAKALDHQVLTLQGQAVLGILMFVFGHGCVDDPLYPWIAQSLEENRSMDPAERTRALAKEAWAFLEHKILAPQEGV